MPVWTDLDWPGIVSIIVGEANSAATVLVSFSLERQIKEIRVASVPIGTRTCTRPSSAVRSLDSRYGLPARTLHVM